MTFTQTPKRRDDEKGQWLFVGILFTGALFAVDLFYSSISEMADLAKVGIWGLHILIAALWVIVMVKFKDPNYDFMRHVLVGLAFIGIFIVALHHATATEDKQVQEDSNKAKQESLK